MVVLPASPAPVTIPPGVVKRLAAAVKGYPHSQKFIAFANKFDI